MDALADETDPATRQRFLDIVARHTMRMERLVADLLRLARLDAGQEVLRPDLCAAASVFASVAAELAPVLEEKEQRVQSRIEPGAERLLVDQVKMHDVIKNLVENAAHYAPERSVVELDAAVGAAGSVVVAARLRSRARHSGYGPDACPSSASTGWSIPGARNPGGTGLGLAIVKHLVTLHDGTVEAAHRPGGGSVFTIVLPRREPAGAALEASRQLTAQESAP